MLRACGRLLLLSVLLALPAQARPGPEQTPDLLLVRRELERGNYARCQTLLSRSRGPRSEVLLLQARLARAHFQLTRGLTAVRQAEAARPPLSPASAQEAGLLETDLLQRQGQLGPAFHRFRQLERMLPPDFRSPSFYLTRAQLQYEAGRLDLARKDLAAGLAGHPSPKDQVDLLTTSAILEGNQGNLRESAQELARAAELVADYRLGLSSLGHLSQAQILVQSETSHAADTLTDILMFHRVFEQAGVPDVAAMVSLELAAMAYNLGHWDLAERQLRSTYREGLESHNPDVVCLCLQIWTNLVLRIHPTPEAVDALQPLLEQCLASSQPQAIRFNAAVQLGWVKWRCRHDFAAADGLFSLADSLARDPRERYLVSVRRRDSLEAREAGATRLLASLDERRSRYVAMGKLEPEDAFFGDVAPLEFHLARAGLLVSTRPEEAREELRLATALANGWKDERRIQVGVFQRAGQLHSPSLFQDFSDRLEALMARAPDASASDDVLADMLEFSQLDARALVTGESTVPGLEPWRESLLGRHREQVDRWLVKLSQKASEASSRAVWYEAHRALMALGEGLTAAGHRAEGADALRRAIDWAVEGQSSALLGQTRGKLARLYLLDGLWKEAVEQLQLQRQPLGGGGYQGFDYGQDLQQLENAALGAHAWLEMQQPARALAWTESVLPLARVPSSQARLFWGERGRALMALGQTAAARICLEKASQGDAAPQPLRADARPPASLTPPAAPLEGGLWLDESGMRESLQEWKSIDPDLGRRLTWTTSDLSSVRGRLAPGEAVLEYVLGSDFQLVVVVAQAGYLVRPLFLDRQGLEGRIRRYRQSVADGKEDVDLARLLYEQLLGALEGSPLRGESPRALARGSLGALSRLYIAPQGELWFLPWDTLEDRSGQRLVQRWTVSLQLNLPREVTLPRAPMVVALGDVRGADLPGTQQELQMLSQLYPRAHLLAGAEATRVNLARACREADILHLASHAVALEHSLADSHIMLSDGPLNLKEAFSLHLKPGALVLLNCCGTGLGERHPGREVAGLAQTFLAAGAGQVVATLWDLDDAGSLPVIRAFYLHLQEGLEPTAALHRAKLDNVGSDPAFWGAYESIQ